MAHRFVKCLRFVGCEKERHKTEKEAGGASRQDSGNRAKSNYLRGDVYTAQHFFVRAKKKTKCVSDACRNYELCGISPREEIAGAGGGEERDPLETADIATRGTTASLLTRGRRLSGDFGNACRGRGS